MSHFRYRCPLRWGDMDAQAHVNNAAFLDYLQEARVHYLLSGPPEMAELLTDGVLVVSHQVEYLRPVRFGHRPLEVDLWVDAVGASRFAIGYDVYDGDEVAARARTTAAPYDLAGAGLRRLTETERAILRGSLDPADPLRPLPRIKVEGERVHRFPLLVRWSDLDSYGHVNNVKFYDYVQEARIALMAEVAEPGPEDIWLLVRQDLEYLKPLDFRTTAYEVASVVAAVGNRSFTIAAEIRDPAAGTVYATARSVVVSAGQLTDEMREALSAWRLGS